MDESLIVQLEDDREAVISHRSWMLSRPRTRRGDVCPDSVREELGLWKFDPARSRASIQSHFASPSVAGVVTVAALREWLGASSVFDEEDIRRGEALGFEFNLDLVVEALHGTRSWSVPSDFVRVGVVTEMTGTGSADYALRVTVRDHEYVIMGLREPVGGCEVLALDPRESGPSAAEGLRGIGRCRAQPLLDDPTGDDVCADAPGARDYLRLAR